MVYKVQRGDTIKKVTGLMNMNWQTLRKLNPGAVGRSSRTGRWFLKEGAVIRGEKDFQAIVHRKKEDFTTFPVPEPKVREKTEDWIEYTIKPGDTLWALAVKRFHVNVQDLIRDNGIQDPRKIRPGQTLRIRRPAYPKEQVVIASWYGKSHHGKVMANGEFFNMYGNTIAHKKLPLGTRVELVNPLTGERARAVVTDRGPYVKGRDVDLSYALARKLSLLKKGVGKLTMRIIG
ncbi:MAG: septal ring lytic transglycosylase RlpA family protein [Deltaproteobacteria bacterium]|nr:septal ring lytic transglycosylase RlpA family protein [Deltaproteobacteria bacterium]MBW2018040.1 septal ring lytic transglycosylase RlpA family protein [Deltaproteobacteria bacterium]MBW2302073.1 septal ring lytic transglycosylase RlpA family protein [Deltaproteobacteria bacterium]